MKNRYTITKQEISKVTHEINSVWHSRYKDLEVGVIYTHPNNINEPAYAYSFINKGFNNYQFIDKKLVEPRS